jgi:hypothetical protein
MITSKHSRCILSSNVANHETNSRDYENSRENCNKLFSRYRKIIEVSRGLPKISCLNFVDLRRGGLLVCDQVMIGNFISVQWVFIKAFRCKCTCSSQECSDGVRDRHCCYSRLYYLPVFSLLLTRIFLSWEWTSL